MSNQMYRVQVEEVTVVTERNAHELVELRDQVLKQIIMQLPADKRKLVQQYLQLQYQLDDAMYLDIYQAGLNNRGGERRGKIKLSKLVS